MSQDNTIKQEFADLKYDYMAFKRYVERELESLSLGLTREKKRNANALRRYKELKATLDDQYEEPIQPAAPQAAATKPAAGTPLFRKFPSYFTPNQEISVNKPLNPLTDQVNTEIENLEQETKGEEE